MMKNTKIYTVKANSPRGAVLGAEEAYKNGGEYEEGETNHHIMRVTQIEE